MTIQTSPRLFAGILAIANAALCIGAEPGSGSARMSRVPLYFEANHGQLSAEVQFMARAAGYTAYLTSREAVLDYHSNVAANHLAIRMSFAGSLPPSNIQGTGRLPGVVNYLIGQDRSQWRTHLPTYSEVNYDGVYPGIDLVYRGSGQSLEFDFRVAPGANPNQIRLNYSGVSKVRVDAHGDLILNAGTDAVRFAKPVVYQDIGGKRWTIAAAYRLSPNGEVGFRLGKYDHTRTLVIDPAIGPSVYYATYLGTTGDPNERFTGLAVDSSGRAFICGITSVATYPTAAEPGYMPYQGSFPSNYTGGQYAGFVTVLNAEGTGIVYTTFISGNSSGVSYGVELNTIAVNTNGNAFVAGGSDDLSFPTFKAFQSAFPTPRVPAETSSAIIFELSPHGDSLVFSSFLGGGDTDRIVAMALDAAGNAYVAGKTEKPAACCSEPVFPTTAGAPWQTSGFPHGVSAFAAKILPPSAGNAVLAYATLIYDSVLDSHTFAAGIAVDSSGNAYLAGGAQRDIGALAGSVVTRHNMPNTQFMGSGDYNVWVVKLNSTGTQALYVDQLGGGGTRSFPTTWPGGIAVDANGRAYVTGKTQAVNFQTTSNAFQPTARRASSSSYDGFVTIISADGTSFPYSTFLNGQALAPGADTCCHPLLTAPVLGPDGQFTVAGVTSTTDFPHLYPTQFAAAGSRLSTVFPSGVTSAAFVTKFGPDLTTGNGLLYSVFFGLSARGESGQDSQVDGIAANGTDIYLMKYERYGSLGTGGAYDFNSGLKEIVMRVQDAPAVETSISVDPKTVQVSPAQITLSSSLQTTPSRTINAGIVSYRVTSSGMQIGSIVTSGIVSGNAASAQYNLPANTPDGTYTITATYNGAAGFLDSTGTAVLRVGSPPNLSISKSHQADHFSQGQSGAVFTLAVSNAGGQTAGTVTVTDNLPTGLTLASMSGAGWTCGSPSPNNVCTRTDALMHGAAYPPITVTVNVTATAPASVVNSASVSVAGDSNSADNTATDPATINPIIDVSNRVRVTQNGFGRNRTTGIWSAAMTVTNISTGPISGPIQVVLTNLSSNATMTNSSGLRNLIPYITVSPGALAPGAAISVPIQFQNSNDGLINFTPLTYSGIF